MTSKQTYRQTLRVPFDFPVVFTRNVFDPANPALAEAVGRQEQSRRHRIVFFVDAQVAAAHPGLAARIAAYATAHAAVLDLAAPPQNVPGGEAAKRSPEQALGLARRLLDLRLCRHSFVAIVGGGAVLDAVGFAASLVHRGLRIVRLPTTVLAQNDAGVGVKTAVNWNGVKNAVGTFAPPFAVLNDFAFLSTLPATAWTDGIAEAFKVAIIKDAAFFAWLGDHVAALRRRDEAAMEDLIRTCARLHLDHIREGGDPFEMGAARPLDFGHWSAHWLEADSGYAVSHGHAVALGILLDAAYAARQGWLQPDERDRIRAHLAAVGFPSWHLRLGRMENGRPAVLGGLADFREHLGGDLCLTMPRGIGARQEVGAIDEALVAACVEELRAAAQG